MLRRKKAQIATLMLPFVTLGLVVASLYTMASFTNKLDNESELYSEIMNNVELAQDYIVAQTKIIVKEAIISCQQCEIGVLKENVNKTSVEREKLFKLEGAGNFYSKIKAGDFAIEELSDSGKKIKVNNLYAFSINGDNKVVRNFNLCLEFNPQGEYFRDC